MTRRHSLLRTFDWKFLVALCFTALVAFAIAGSVHTWDENQAKGRRIDALIAGLHAEQRAGARAGHEASRERDHLLHNQARLLTAWRKLDARQQAILTYLRAQGIELPARYEVASDSSAHDDGAPAPSDHADHDAPAGPTGGHQGNGHGPGAPPSDSPLPTLPPVLPPLPSTKSLLPDHAGVVARTRTSTH